MTSDYSAWLIKLETDGVVQSGEEKVVGRPHYDLPVLEVSL